MTNKDNYRNGASRRSFLKSAAAISLCGVFSGAYRMNGQAGPQRPEGGSLRISRAGKFVPVMLTPFRSDLSVDVEALDRLTDFYGKAGAQGLFANCLSSEMYYLTPAERLTVTRRVMLQAKGQLPVVSTGSFGNSLKEKAEFTKALYDTGVDAVILITSHFAGREEEDPVLIRNLESFLQLTGSIPLGTYECPSPYKRLLSPEVYSFLLASGRFVYHKDTSENIRQIETKLQLSKNSPFKLYNAHTASALASLKAGAAGLSPISGNFYPEIIQWICENARDPEKQENATWIQSEIALAEPIISRAYPLSAKYFLQKRGVPLELHCRAPRKTLTGENKEALEEMHDRFLGWCGRLGIEPVKA
ncbi:MAG TPA: dihydrodipicolinate synthase family protein [Anseongella sp.]|nr:dihydrodipicolinate synthase family protein [Anseongella sp.]